MARPEHLPDFESPPLDELVLGVQFSPLPGYSAVFAKDVWGLFRQQFPRVEEKPALDPVFETFGGTSPPPGMQLRFGPPSSRTRLWFVSSDEDHLIQFQEDRILLNWRKRNSKKFYPRFETISKSYGEYLESAENFFLRLFSQGLDINQAEISYINIIPVESYSQIGDWFDIGRFGEMNHEVFNLQFGEIILNQENKPYARLICDLKSAITIDGGSKVFNLTFTFRGKPVENNIISAMNFLRDGRERIVHRFDQLTTEKAHLYWRKRK